MKRIPLLIIVCLLVISCDKKENSKTIPEKPNILFISIDDLNNWPGFLGNSPNAHTPNMDKLAASGMAFKNAHCQAPICAPSRTSVFTGLHPHTTGLYYQFNDKDIRNSSEAAKNSIFMPDYFEKYGYKTLGVGKIFHNGDKLSVFEEHGDVFPKMSFGPYLEKRANYDCRWFSDIRRTGTDWGPMELPDSDMSDYKIADWTVKKLKEDHDKPFFMAVGFIRPHTPWYVPQKWFDMFDLDSIETPPYLSNDLDDVPEISRQMHDMPAMPRTEWLIKEDKWKNMVRAYLASMAFVDYQLGKVLTALEESKYKDNTIIVLWSDHGYHLGEKGRTCKHSLWRPATNVPLVFAGPNIKKSSTTNQAVGLIDLYPTLLEMCNLPKNTTNEGHSIVPLINNPEQNWEYPAITSYGHKNVSLYKDAYHFIHYTDGSGELYNIEDDPNEWKNLYNDLAYSEVITDFKALLPKTYAPMAPSNKINANPLIDKILLEFGIDTPTAKKN
ncbi:sulfatase [Tamlana sp. 2201CG12-4]|uniref:sulfatase n=1 Tax=Tamlana sp. 2201CG12-4 TaxID=3112582 RepID=UPI002DBA4325|nr:sulfatase [Tamlana sp. 2201CG12-4]MEC3908801.1 sulfatase [Tamlana sp. 2201CG12-4]